ncbi:HAMP domain-containing histidine kinase [Romeria aff. gracilis LEGE 07310]|uniref:histidine kinase n=1 Tax=Vasconcelosia minhoensis LEGE 07310 TaxID=915328 RepID=A0A8J7A8H7_9CYAN|nr:HAMP domain-containing sensor histidine kinase [Romeria gracilis]MBE9075911.1 HAMP domain-containing histidine kinase [Romeria aff. gracilis LEGE 07310]
MTVVASPEFMALCQAQLALLAQRFEQTTAAIYLAQQSSEQSQPNFVPFVSYPDSFEAWAAPQAESRTSSVALPASGSGPTQPKSMADASVQQAGWKSNSGQHPTERFSRLSRDRQFVVPLVYTDVVVGLLVAIRHDRQWRPEEEQLVEQAAEALAAGCVLERRNQWLQQRLQRHRDFRSRQSEVFHNLLHQFRNPLTALTTFGRLLTRRLNEEDPNYGVATSLLRESQRLRELAADFDATVRLGDVNLSEADTSTSSAEDLAHHLELPAAESSAGSPPLLPMKGLGRTLSLSPQFLPQVLEPLLAVAQMMAAEKQITLMARISADTPPVMGDPEALQEVLNNLIDNALKYADCGAWVWVQTGLSQTTEAGHYQGVVIGDTGPGIPSGDLSQLFQRSYRGVQAQGRIPGTGLGLAIVKDLMTQMQGTIDVVSPVVGTPWIPERVERQLALDRHQKQGPGTAFILWLPELTA